MDKVLGFKVTSDRHYRYHLAARFAGRTLTDVVTEKLDAWADEILWSKSLADLIAACKQEDGQNEQAHPEGGGK